MKCSISEKPFGIFDNKPVTQYTLTNNNGMQVSVINYGATITRIITPDRNNNKGNVIFGFDTLDGYLENADKYIGSVVGRYCNRIGKARFFIDGIEYMLAKNEQQNNLHGGIKGFDKVWWNIEGLEDNCSLKLTYLSKDGEEGFPGNMYVEIIYSLSDDNALTISYAAVCDKPSPVNLTSHCYFNLSAGTEAAVTGHELLLFSDEYTVLDENNIPTGDIASVENTAYDFRNPSTIGKQIDQLPGGYDINYVLNKQAGIAAILYHQESGRVMEVFTTEPGLQLYSAGNMEGSHARPGDKPGEAKYTAICLEAQHFPNSPNIPAFPDTILRPGAVYRQSTAYKFSVK